jgi:hypothetical protein
MRWLTMCFVVALAVAASARTFAQQPGTDAAQGPGCLGQKVEACVQSLRASMQLDEGRLASALSRRHMTDVNGRPFGAGLVNISGRIPGRTQTQVMLLRLAADDTVASVEASLLGDLIPARAAEAYDQSGVYDIVARILGRRCPGLERLALYRFIENAMKPRIKMERRDLSAGLLGRHRLTARAADVPWCGAHFTYTTFVEWTGANNMESGRNPAGYWSIEVK